MYTAASLHPFKLYKDQSMFTFKFRFLTWCYWPKHVGFVIHRVLDNKLNVDLMFFLQGKARTCGRSVCSLWWLCVGVSFQRNMLVSGDIRVELWRVWIWVLTTHSQDSWLTSYSAFERWQHRKKFEHFRKRDGVVCHDSRLVAFSGDLWWLFFIKPAGLATPNSLVLIDEVGRGTSPLEGIGISHAIAEELIKLKVSHFPRNSGNFEPLTNSSRIVFRFLCHVSYLTARMEQCISEHKDHIGTSTNCLPPYHVSLPSSSASCSNIHNLSNWSSCSLHLSVQVFSVPWNHWDVEADL